MWDKIQLVSKIKFSAFTELVVIDMTDSRQKWQSLNSHRHRVPCKDEKAGQCIR